MRAGKAVIVHGGDSNNRSTSKNAVGLKWNDRSVGSGRASSAGTTSSGSISLREKYKSVISSDIGADVMLIRFLARKRAGERVRSAQTPRKKVSVLRERPIMVRYWKCQP
jgi:hypothetical protein